MFANPKTMTKGKFLTIALAALCFQGLYIQAGFAVKAVYFVGFIALASNWKADRLHPLVAHEYVLLAFFAIFLLLSTGSNYPEMSLRFFLGVILMFITYYGVRAVVVESDSDDLIKSLTSAGIIFSLVSIALYILGLASGGFQSSFEELTVRWGVSYDRGIPRLSGATRDPNFYMAFNCLFVYLALARIKTTSGKLLLALSLLTSILTFSRGGFLALFSGLIIFIFAGKHYRLGMLALALIGTTAGVAYVAIPDFSIFLERRLSTVSDGSGRFEIWQNGLKLFSDNKLIGIGAFNFLQENTSRFGGEHYMHNTFLEVLVEGGVISFSIYLLFWALLSISLIGSHPRKPDHNLSNLRTITMAYTGSTITSLASLSGSISEPFFICTLLATYIAIKCSKKHGKTKSFA